MSRTTSTHRFGVQELAYRPVAQISPEEATEIIGTSVTLSGTGSTVNGVFVEGMTYTWSVSSPDGSSVEGVTLIEEDGSQVRLDGDTTGTFVVSLVVSYEGLDSEQVSVGVFYSPIVVPAVKRLVPDGTFMFRVLSDFWKLINDRELFPIVWSSYTQTVASDFLRALQIDRAKSIRTIQPLFQKRFLNFSPKMEIDRTALNMILGNHQSGSSAFTGDVTFVDRGALVSTTEFLLLNTASSTAIGSNLTIYSGDNAGEYLINRLNAAGDGFIVSESTPFPDYRSSILVSGSDLVSLNTTSLYATSTDLSSATAGDFLRVKEGTAAGFYKITAVGTADGLTSDRHIEVDTTIGSSSNIKFDIFQSTRVSYLKSDAAFTDTVYIPKDDADLDAYSVDNLTSLQGEIVSDYEIIVDNRHLVDSAIDKKISITTGTIAGASFTISGFNESRTGFLVTEPFSTSVIPETVGYSISIESSVADRLLILDGIGHDIANFTLLEGLTTVEEGGRGDLWVITLAGNTAPSRREGMNWRIGSTIESEVIDDFEKYGVAAGDLLAIEVFRQDLQVGSFLYATITGASKNQISFELGTSALSPGSNGSIDASNVAAIAFELSIPTVTISEATGEALYTSSALDIYGFLNSSSFSSAYFNYPLDAETSIDVDGFFSIYLRPSHIIRNSKIALDPEEERPDEPIFSIPSLVEYLSPESVSEVEDGYRIVATDGTVTLLSDAPTKLVENINYKISSNTLTGSAAETIAGSATITVTDVDLVKNRIEVGDTIELLDGNSRGVYVISSVINSTSVRVGGRTEDSSLPVLTEASIRYEITRKHEGQFLQFISTFTPASPAPDTLWAPITLVDNFKYIENNFGLLVGVTKEDIDEFGTSPISYKSAIAGLMYCWATGPTFRSVEIGAHILLDAPVSETLGQIVEISDNYAESGQGRILIEDLDKDGLGKGIYRSYPYDSSQDFNLDRFKGLATNPLTSEIFAVGDVVYPFTPLSSSVVISDRVTEPGWWSKYGNVTGALELEKYHTWQAEFDLKTLDSRDIGLAADFLMKIRPIYTKPRIVGVLALQDIVYIEDDLFIDMDVFLFDDPAFSRESTHMVDSYNDSGVATRLLDFGSYSTRTLFRGDDLAVDVSDPTLVTSERGGFVSGTTNDDGEQILPQINSYFQDEVKIRGQAFVRVGDVLYISTGRNRGRFLVSEVVSDTELRVSQYTDSAPRGIDPSTHMRTDSGAYFHIQRYEDSVITTGSEISSVGGTTDGLQTDNIIVVDSAKFWSNGVTADDVLVIATGNNRGVYHIEDVGEYQIVAEYFEHEETTLTLRETLPDPADLSHAFEIRRRVLLENPTFSAVDGVTTAAANFITSASHPDLSLISKGDTLTPSTGQDAGVVFRVVGVSGDTIHVDLPFTASEDPVEFAVSHLVYEQDDSDSDYRFERLHPKDEVEITLYRPLTVIYSGSFDLSDNGDANNPICQATAGTDLELLATPVQVGDVLEVEVVAADLLDASGLPGSDGIDDTTTSASHGMYGITDVSGAVVQVDQFFPGVQITGTDPVVPELGVQANIYTPDDNFSVSGDTVSLVSLLSDHLDVLGIVPGDFFEDSSGNEYLIIDVSGSTLTLAEDTGLSGTTMSGRIFRRSG